jgi:hypothetical protein
MELAKKIVTKIPLSQLWDSNKLLEAKREAYLTQADIKGILQTEPTVFIVANLGKTLQWIKPSEIYAFWKSTAKNHIADDLSRIDYESFPDNYAFVASKWVGEGEEVIVLLEKFH